MTGNPMTAIMNPKENAEKESIQARSDLTKQMVDSHVAKMNSALDVYTKTQDTARQMQDTSIQMQNNLANLRKEIAELDITKATLVFFYISLSLTNVSILTIPGNDPSSAE
jgi:hypothetical protein